MIRIKLSSREKFTFSLVCICGTATFLEFPPVFIGKGNRERCRRWGPRGQEGWFFYSGFAHYTTPYFPSQWALNLRFPRGDTCSVNLVKPHGKLCFGEVRGGASQGGEGEERGGCRLEKT